MSGISVTYFSPEGLDGECYYCKKFHGKAEPLSSTAEIPNTDKMYAIETIMQFCPCCGKRLVPVELAIQAYKERILNDIRIGRISAEIATDEVLVAISEALSTRGVEHFTK